MDVITRVAGTGRRGYAGDTRLATEAELSGPMGVAVTPDGSFFIADAGNFVVRMVHHGVIGVIRTLAGIGAAGNSGDGGRATDAELNRPGAVAMMADGGFLIADTVNHQVRRVLPDGAIVHVAGTGTPGKSGNGGPAAIAALYFPSDLAVMADGGFLIADSGNHAVRRVAPDGVITLVAGIIGTAGNSGDDGLATDAKLNRPNGVAVMADGGFLIADTLNHEVRRVSPAGVITRVAGTGTVGNSGDDGPATNAQLNNPSGVAVTADGGFLIADTYNHEVRKVAAGEPHRTAAAGGRPLGRAV
jgi:sugar lactone lactonase YvrE